MLFQGRSLSGRFWFGSALGEWQCLEWDMFYGCNLEAMASTLLAMASNLPGYFSLQHFHLSAIIQQVIL